MSQEKVADIINLNASRQAQEAEKETAGDFLRAARIAAGLDIAGVSAEIKLKEEHLEAIEANDHRRLPATPYAVGFVKVYAQFLGLDADAVARQFKIDIGAGEGAIGPAVNGAEESDASPDFGEGARFASIFGVIAIIGFMIWAVFQVTGTAERTSAGAEANRENAILVADQLAPTPQPRLSSNAAIANPAVVVTEGVAPEIVADEAAAQETAGEAIAAAAGAGNLEAVADGPEAATPPESTDAAATQNRSSAIEGEESAAADGGETIVADPSVIAEPQEAPVVEPQPRSAPPAPVVVAARLERSIAPNYPSACDRGADALEKVDLIFDITAEGRPANARVASTTNDCFNEAALNALRRWRFDPKTVDGAPRPDLAKRATLNFRR